MMTFLAGFIGALMLVGLPLRILYIGMLIGYRWARESVAANGTFSDHVASLLKINLQRRHRRAWKVETVWTALNLLAGAALVWWALR